MAKVDLSFDAVHRTGTATTGTELGTYFIPEAQAEASCTATITNKPYVYDSTTGKIALTAGDFIEYKGKADDTADGKLILMGIEFGETSTTITQIATLTEANPRYTATEDMEFYLGAGNGVDMTQDYYYQITHVYSWSAAADTPIELKKGDILTIEDITGYGANSATYYYFEEIGNFDEANQFLADGCIAVMTPKGHEITALYEGDTFTAEEDCVIVLAALDDNVGIEYDILPIEPKYEEEYTGGSGILAWKREKKGKMRFFLHIDGDSNDDIGYMEVEPAEDAQGMRYLNMTGFDELKIVSDGEVYECIINEC